MDQKELAALHAQAEAALKQYPGVVGVGFGLKEVGGKTTDQRAFRVYVREKLPRESLDPADVIPETFGGFPVDVLVVRQVELHHCEDMQQHSPLIGGISITNFKTDASGDLEAGTLGFFATIDGVSGPENVVLVSNHHVLMALSAAVGDTIYQPLYKEVNGVVTVVGDSDKRNPIGKIDNSGKKANHSFTYPSETALDYHLDCATAKLDICVSSWCNTNCGVSYKNEIRALNIGGNSKIEGVARVAQADVDAPGDYIVYKVGRTTSRTKGRVIEVMAVGAAGETGMIEIEAVENDCNGILRFSAKGDSGSAIVNEQNQLIGILFGSDHSNPTRSFASHIHPVLDYLKVTPISTANPPVGPAGQALSNVEGFITGGNETVALRERFLATPKGAELYERLLEHRAEVVGLVNHRRPVTVAWHRSKGPLFLGHLINNARDPNHQIPHEFEGIGRKDLIRRMAEVLSQHGSESLRRDIEDYFDEVMSCIDDFDDLHEFVKRFETVNTDA